MTDTKTSRLHTARIGVTSGMMIRKNVCTWLAPSTFAASSRDIGKVSKKPLISHTWPSELPHSTMM